MANCYIVTRPDWEWQEIVAGFTTKRGMYKWAFKHRPKADLTRPQTGGEKCRLKFYRTRGELVVDITKDVEKIVTQFWRSEILNKKQADGE